MTHLLISVVKFNWTNIKEYRLLDLLLILTNISIINIYAHDVLIKYVGYYKTLYVDKAI
jgi:hypothetical protein